MVASRKASAGRLEAAGPYHDVFAEAALTLPVTTEDRAKVAALVKEIAEIERAVKGCAKRARAAADRFAKIPVEKKLLT